MSSSESSPEPVAPGRSARLLRRIALGTGVLGVLCAGGVLGPMKCWSAWMRWGIDVHTCPAGTPLQRIDVSVDGISRATYGYIRVSGEAVYTTHRADGDQRTNLDVHRSTVTLVRADGTRSELIPHEDGWEHHGDDQVLRAKLPADLPDGDHTLEVVAHTRLGEETLTVKLPVFAPAKVHLLTDRPLYEPGHTVAFRSVVLRARDLVPLGGRPGTFTVRTPDGTTVFEERAPASDWGVASSTFPLAADAPLGTWSACWRSHNTSSCTPFEVTEFTLPRFTVEASSRTAWVGRGETPTVDGTVRLASGAPVANAAITVSWHVQGAWTMPHDWTRDGLPKHAVTDQAGRFELQLPAIPEDLVGTATLVGQVAAVDEAGDRQTTTVGILLSVDDLAVDAVTELTGSGVAEGMNNRVWLRATTPAGAPMPGATVSVQRAWDPTAPALTATADEDGVAVFQLDPGPPVNVLVQDPPERPPPPPEPVAIQHTADPTGQTTVSLADQRALDAYRTRMDACRDTLGNSAASARLTLFIDRGRVVDAWSLDQQPSECVADRLRGQPMPVGPPRAVELRATLQPMPTPSLTASLNGWMHHGAAALDDSLEDAMVRGRSCLSGKLGSHALVPVFQWSTTEGSRAVTVRSLGSGTTVGADRACLERALSSLRLAEPSPTTAVGQLRLSSVAAPAQQSGASIPRERVVLGYELAVAATTSDGEDLGTTTVVLPPGTIPDIRLRADPVLPSAGDTVTVTVLRGPNFAGKLPEELVLQHDTGARIEAKLDEKTREAAFELPADQTGWYTVRWGGATSRVYVAPTGSLDVSVAVNEDVLRPGETAELTVTTVGADGPVPAAVSLVGVDETLQALAPLPGPGELDSLRDRVPTPTPAFGTLDGVALVQGAIRGDNARAATILGVGMVPSPSPVETPVSSTGHTTVDPRTVLMDRFFPILGELARAERSWQKSAAPEDRLTPEQTAALWRQARDAAEAAGHPVTDAYGKPLLLHRLPSDLLDMTAPHAIVTDGARLPDDLENWTQWVHREEPR